MKVTVFLGSGRKKHTYKASELFLKNLKAFENIETEIVPLMDYNLKICNGCSVCLNKGEEFCPLQDDRDILLKKIENSDGIVFAVPNYSFQVSGIMKIFLDRFGFIFHRPRYFHKKFTSLVTEGVYGGKNIVKYFNFIGNALGINVNGSLITTKEPITKKRKLKNENIILNHSKRFYKTLQVTRLKSPTLFELMIFRISRSSIKRGLSKDFKDYTYYKNHGWFESDFYYPVTLNPVKKVLGQLFDKIPFK